jgi:hypothetical protein
VCRCRCAASGGGCEARDGRWWSRRHKHLCRLDLGLGVLLLDGCSEVDLNPNLGRVRIPSNSSMELYRPRHPISSDRMWNNILRVKREVGRGYGDSVKVTEPIRAKHDPPLLQVPYFKLFTLNLSIQHHGCHPMLQEESQRSSKLRELDGSDERRTDLQLDAHFLRSTSLGSLYVYHPVLVFHFCESLYHN